MNFEDFDSHVVRHWRCEIPLMLHESSKVGAALGLTGEAGEVAELVKKDIFHGKTPERDRMVEELGDVLFYWVRLTQEYGITFREVMRYNKEKLEKRRAEGR